MAKKATTKKTKKKIMSLEDKARLRIQRLHIKAVRRILSNVGFRRVAGVSDKEFTFENQTTDFDDIYVLENAVVLVEYTTSKSSNIGDHLKNKKIIYDKINSNKIKFIEFLKKKFTESANQFPENYHESQIILKILYCSRYDFDGHYRGNVPGPVYLNYPEVQYFTCVAAAIKRSARFEFLHFMGISSAEIGKGGTIAVSERSHDFRGSILPEAHSNFDSGFKVVSFYANADALLRTSYVMRRDGWRDSENLYQRMISKTKIERIRAYLKKQKRVFINNIIVTLPSDVRPLTEDKKTINAATLIKTAPITITLPERANSVGIIDGQHRVFAYHETEIDDPEIARMRGQQNLLVTGIIYPENLSDAEKEKFEAKLFLEINSNQTNAGPTIKHAIGMVIDPFSTDSIATRIINGLAKRGPLSGFVQQYFWDSDKLKTASIVSYGLKPLVKTSGKDSLYHIWEEKNKAKLIDGSDDELLKKYIEFCVTSINIVLSAIKFSLDVKKWTADKKIPGKVISTTYINSFLIVARLLIENNIILDFEKLKNKLKGLDNFSFSMYKSSQYRRMAEEIIRLYFGASSTAVPAAAPVSVRKPRARVKLRSV